MAASKSLPLEMATNMVGGCIPSKKLSVQPKFGNSRKYSDKELPKFVDLRPMMTPIENQGNSYACVGNALAGAYEFFIMKNAKKHINVSRLFIYYNSRLVDGLTEEYMIDHGTTIESGIKALTKYGCCKETLFPYEIKDINRKPKEICYKEGSRFRIVTAMQLNPNLSEMRACLAQGYPFVFGIKTFNSFHSMNKKGLIQTPDPDNEEMNQDHGWHAMLAVGYNDNKECFIVRNSWGENWGDRGYCYIPYEYMCNPMLCCDLHAIKLISNDDPISIGADEEVKLDFWKILLKSDSLDLEELKQCIIVDQWFWKVQQSLELSCPKQFDEKSQVVEKKTSPSPCILWIDENNDENRRSARRILDETNVSVDFSPNPSTAEAYIVKKLKDVENLPPLGYLQIICRGYYKRTNETSMHVLRFLDQKKVKSVPVMIYTRDAIDTKKRLIQQATEMGNQHWMDRLFITDNRKNLIKELSTKLSLYSR